MTQQTELQKTEKNIVDDVHNRVKTFEQLGQIKIPKDYFVGNALKAAMLTLRETQTKDKKPVLDACSRESVANSLLKMVVQGLSPLKKQGYFIAYGNKLNWQESYFGNIALAKRYGGLKRIPANVIYEGDNFIYEKDPQTGLTKVVEHKQELGNIDITKIRGAYAVAIFEDYTDTTIMTLQQIKQAWEQGQMKGQSGAHKNFTDEMCKKTVINRACKSIVNESSDGDIIDEKDETRKESLDNQVEENANKEEVSFEADATTGEEYQEVEEAEYEVVSDEQKEQEEQQPKEDDAQNKGQQKAPF